MTASYPDAAPGEVQIFGANGVRLVRYRPLPGNPRYRVGDDGSVWSRRGTLWGPLRMRKNDAGYLTVRLGRYRQEKAHRLVLLAFVGPCPPGMQSRHLDGNPANNRLGNLAWGTPKENAADKVRHGTSFRHGTAYLPPPRCLGETNGLAKLTASEVQEIRKLRAEDKKYWTYKRLAQKFAVALTTVRDAANRKYWKHVI